MNDRYGLYVDVTQMYVNFTRKIAQYCMIMIRSEIYFRHLKPPVCMDHMYMIDNREFFTFLIGLLRTFNTVLDFYYNNRFIIFQQCFTDLLKFEPFEYTL